MVRLRPFFKYYGSKHRLAPWYPPPKHKLIVEPFAGSAQYATLHHEHDVILCETDPDVAALWQYLIESEPWQIRQLPVKLEPGLDIRDLDVPYGGQLLIRHWQRVGVGRCWTVSKWNGMNSGMWCESTRDCIAAQTVHIRHWCVCCESIVGMAQDTPATWFVDPPYQGQARVYANEAPDFAALGSWCRDLPGQVIVCEAPGADWLPFRELRENTVGRTHEGGERAKRMEMIWTNE